MENDYSRHSHDNDKAEAPESLEDDDDSELQSEKKSSRGKQKPRKSIIFFGKQEVEEDDSSAEKSETRQKGAEQRDLGSLFSGILRDDVEPAAEEDTTEPHGSEPEQSSEIATPEAATDELKEDFQEIVAERIQEVEQELELPSVSEDTAAVQADAAFLARVDDRLEQNMPPEAAIEDAFEDEFMPPQTDASPEDLAQEAFYEATDTTDTEEDTQTVPLASAQTMPGAIPIPLSVPPRRPQGPTGAAGYGGGMIPPGMYGGGAGGSHPNTLPPTPNRIPQNPNIAPMNEMYYRDRNTGRVLLAGIVGYMIGRRGGRKRTEARLQPEIKKREEQLDQLSTQLRESEQKVRQMVYAAQPESVPKQSKEKQQTKVEVQKQKTVETIALKNAPPLQVERALVEEQEKQFEQTLQQRIERGTAPPVEVEITPSDETLFEQTLLAPLAAAELLNRRHQEKDDTLMTEAAPAVRISESEAEQEKQSVIDTREKPVVMSRNPRTMTVPELLEVAEHIGIERTSLRELYERNRVDVVNMRRVITEYLHGGNYEKVLRGSLGAFEMQRELRHEIKRGDLYTSYTGGASASSTSDTVAAAGLFGASSQQLSQQTQLSGSAENEPGNDEFEEEVRLSNRAAITVGVLTGVLIMVVMFIYLSA